MNNKDNLRREFLQVMNENIKSELRRLITDNSETTRAILAEPYGKLSTETMDIVITTLTNGLMRNSVALIAHGIRIMHACKKSEFSIIYH